MFKVSSFAGRIGLIAVGLLIAGALTVLWSYQNPQNFLGYFTNPTPTAAAQGLYLSQDRVGSSGFEGGDLEQLDAGTLQSPRVQTPR